MESSSLKKWGILKHMRDEEISNIAYLQVYGGSGRSSDAGLSALYVTNDDEVFGTGFNTMIGLETGSLTFDGGKHSKGRSVKVYALSGLKITKIVVGEKIGAAISSKGEVYTWGSFVFMQPLLVEMKDIVMFESYVPSKHCRFCSNNFYREELIGSTSISKCTMRCNKYSVYTHTDLPPSGTPVLRFIRFTEPVFCPKCMSPTSSKSLDGSQFHFCAKCNMMVEVPNNIKNNLKLFKSEITFMSPQKLQTSQFWEIRSVYCGSTFLVIETSSSLFLWGTIDGFGFQACVSNPDNVRFKNVSCGGSHLAVISSRGELYTCGLGSKGQLGYKWNVDMGHTTLRKVPLNGRVVKVCCGYSSTACLMSNGSIMCFGSNMKMSSSGIMSLTYSEDDFIDAPSCIMESVRFVDLTHSPLNNIFCAKAEDFKLFVWGNSKSTVPQVQFKVSELAEALADLPYTFTGASQVKDTVEQLLIHSACLGTGTFFGNVSFSDLTLKLADGEFPVHRLVLHSNSSYFREILSDKVASDVLDMTSYNPTAYKCLLKYIYGLPLDELNCEDLFDLHSIACSYKEKELVDSTFKELKTMINPNTVLKLHAKATSTNAEDILKECELFFSSPELKTEVMSFFFQDMKNAMAILRIKSGE